MTDENVGKPQPQFVRILMVGARVFVLRMCVSRVNRVDYRLLADLPMMAQWWQAKHSN